MKRLNEYTKYELANMTDEEVSLLIEIECAYEGTGALPKKPEQPKITKPVFDVQVYSIPSMETMSKEFIDELEVLIAKYGVCESSYNSDTGYDNRYIIKSNIDKDDYNYPQLRLTPRMSKESFDTLRQGLVKSKELSEVYQEELSLYNSISKKITNVESYVTKSILNARQYFKMVNRFKETFNSYLRLAEGNGFIAERFMENNCPQFTEYSEVVDYIKSQVWEGVQ